MTESALAAAKRAMRLSAKTRRAALVRRDDAFPQRIDHVLAASSLVGGQTVVSGYWPMAEEADIRPILTRLHGAGHRCGLPVVVGTGRPLSFRLWTPESVLRPDRFGVATPPAESPALEPDLILVPLLAFDRNGYRLGYGGGFYDCTLAALRACKSILAIGVAYADQEVDAVPHEPHDQRLDGVLTERGLLTF